MLRWLPIRGQNAVSVALPDGVEGPCGCYHLFIHTFTVTSNKIKRNEKKNAFLLFLKLLKKFLENSVLFF